MHRSAPHDTSHSVRTLAVRTPNIILAASLALLLLAPGCRRSNSELPDVRVDLTLTPSPPVVGDAAAQVSLADAENKPLAGAVVRLEGNMNHAGMTPSFADLTENAPGHYAGTLKFTMGGDWYILVNAKLPDGRKLERKIDIRGVQAP